jgi:hypothetical protein
LTGAWRRLILPSVDDYFGGDYLQDICEMRLLDCGGQALRDDAHDEAGRYVDENYPWNGRGDEPADRISAYCAVLWQRAEAVTMGDAGGQQ